MDEITQVKQRFSIIGNSPSLLEAIGRAVKVAPIDLSVLVTGESGSGKEFFPKIIHAYGARKHKKYIAVNCGAIPEGTIDSELFGHEKGAFTGAISTRKGYFEEADGGTIFLDEVAELPLTTQARLLRVLETGEFLKVGSSVVQKTDIRIVAATNVDLLKAVAKGKFREDLYYRLSTVVINVPPLHDRGEDVVLLARKFAVDFAEKYVMPAITFSEEARRAMLLYRWPGNVRQLKNVVEQLALFNAGEEIDRVELLNLLPVDYSGNASLVAPKPEHRYEAEREMLWQLIYGMRSEINELTRRIDSLQSDEARLIKPDNVQTLIKYVPPKDSFIEEDKDDAGISGSPLNSPLNNKEESQETGEEKNVSLLEQAEKKAIEEALRRHDGNKKAASEELNISSRTLYRKIKELGIKS